MECEGHACCPNVKQFLEAPSGIVIVSRAGGCGGRCEEMFQGTSSFVHLTMLWLKITLQVLYTMDFTKLDTAQDLQWFKDHCYSTFKDFQQLFCRDRALNYIHELMIEAPKLVEKNNGIYAYANDVTETMNCIMKTIAARFMQWGAAHGQPWQLEVHNRVFMQLHCCLMSEGPYKLIKLQKDMCTAYKVLKELSLLYK